MASSTNTAPQSGAKKFSWAKVAAAPRPQQQVPAPKAGSSSPAARRLAVASKGRNQQEDVSVLVENLALGSENIDAGSPVETTQTIQAVNTIQVLQVVEAAEQSNSVAESEDYSAPTSAASSDSLWEFTAWSESFPSTPPSENSQEHQPKIQAVSLPYKLHKAVNNLKLLREFRGKKNIAYIAIDLETTFFSAKRTGKPLVLEVGATWWDGESSGYDKLRSNAYHYIIKEYKDLQNTPKFKPGNKYNHKNDFLGDGKMSQLISFRKVGADLKYYINESEEQGEVVIVVHGGKSDVENLAEMQCDISHLPIMDTQLIDQALYWEKYGAWQDPQSLANTVYDAGFTPDPLLPFHNAGNDALFTMVALTRLKEKVDSAVGMEVRDEN